VMDIREQITELRRNQGYGGSESAADTMERMLEDNERLRDPDWKTYIEITSKWLEKYPPDIFTGVSGDSGPLFVVAIRKALAALEDETSARQACPESSSDS